VQWGEDLFKAAKRAGLTTAAIFWPVTGCHPDIDYLINEYWPEPGDTDIREVFRRAGSSEEMIDIVEKNLQNPDFNVKRLAEMLNMSQPTLYRRVKMLTNYTIIELTRGVRLKRAAELLRTRQYSIQEVSEMVGYNDAPTFRKHFVEFYGSTPSTFVSKEEAQEKK
jgi:AraC-like DNA-binding protein